MNRPVFASLSALALGFVGDLTLRGVTAGFNGSSKALRVTVAGPAKAGELLLDWRAISSLRCGTATGCCATRRLVIRMCLCH